MSMGKVLGGGSSMNAMAWSRGHRSDWDLFVAESGEHVVGLPVGAGCLSNASRTGTVRPIPCFAAREERCSSNPLEDPHPVALAMLEAAESVGIPTFENPNGRLMEANTGAALGDLRIRDGKRVSIFRSYTYPYMDRPNLTVLTHALVTGASRWSTVGPPGSRSCIKGKAHRIGAGVEVILSLGAIHTPKVLMQSGIGDEQELRESRHSGGAASARRGAKPTGSHGFRLRLAIPGGRCATSQQRFRNRGVRADRRGSG